MLARVEYLDAPQTAYCPNLETRRQIRMKLAKVKFSDSTPQYSCLIFDCPEFAECEFVDENKECTFIAEVLNRFYHD